MNSDAVVQIGTVIIALIGAVITYIIVPYFKSKTTKEQRESIAFWVRVAVNAAEQIYDEKGQGKVKKEYVIKFLSDKGITLTLEQLDVLIEAAVYELNKMKTNTPG